MKISRLYGPLVAATALVGATQMAHATNGYFSHGYGMKAKGMAGASTADADSAFAGANNPAAAAFAGNRLEVGLDHFAPSRDVTIMGNKTTSSKNSFFVPEIGYNRAISDTMGFNLTIYGNGGMNTTYETNVLGGTGKLGVDLMQLIIAPTFAYKFDPNHSIGISPVFVYQQFEAYGLQAFEITSNPGKDSSTGFGFRLGYIGKLSPYLTVGAVYSPKVNMSKFDKYNTLFAEQGDFDIPENYSLGLRISPTEDLSFCLCYQKINYSGVASIANTGTTMGTNPLGAANGPGFGWTDVNVYRLGVNWKLNDTWTLRAGYNRGDNPVKSEEIGFNILAPGVVKEHYTLGASYSLDKKNTVTVAYMHAARNEVSGQMMTPGGAVPTTIGMSQNSFGVQYSHRF